MKLYIKGVFVVLACFLALPSFLEAQTHFKLKSFKTGIYNQKSTGNGIDYAAFKASSKSSSFLPSAIEYSNTLTETTLNNAGIYFGFEFQIESAEADILNRHSFTLDIRNNLFSSRQPNNVFVLELNEADSTKSAYYNMGLKSEIFGVGVGYQYQWLNKKRVSAHIGGYTRYDIPVSRSLLSSGFGSNKELSGNDFKYFLVLNSGLFVAPSLGFSYQITNYLSLAFDYSIGIQSQKIDETRFTSSSRIAEFGLKFTI